METTDLEKTVRSVLTALNIDPEGFQLAQGFLNRVLRSGKPRAVILDEVEKQFVFMGIQEGTVPGDVCEVIADEALASLSEPAREDCQHLVVGWINPQDQAFAAVFDILADSTVGPLIASSWTPPEAWKDPMIDVSQSGDAYLNDLLDQLEAKIRHRGNKNEPQFATEIKRYLGLIDIALRRLGGEGQLISEYPSVYASDEAWSSWVYFFTQSVLDEWKRVGGHIIRELPPVTRRSVEGPLNGLRVFISYARAEAVTLAWPVHAALSALGATVWFDREQSLDIPQLALGLSDTIASCDAYIMCASDEFFERAGYAMQELAWAIQQQELGGKTQYFLVVAQPNTVLPSAVSGWPIIELQVNDSGELARRLAPHLQGANPPRDRLPNASLASLPHRTMLPPPSQVNIPALLQRVQHIRLYNEIPTEVITDLISGKKDDRRAEAIRKRLINIGEGLDWTGTLSDIHLWPNDPLIQDARLRLAGARAVIGTRWPLNDDLNWEPGVVNDVEFLAMQRPPISAWPTVIGWNEIESRFALRHYAGLLRALQGLLRHGLTGGLLRVQSSTLNTWEDELSMRQRECYDDLLSLRLQGLLGWQGNPILWDALFLGWYEFIARPTHPWLQKVPPAVLQTLVGNVSAIAAIAADTSWYVSRYGGFASLSITPRGINSQAIIEVYALSSTGTDQRGKGGSENNLRLGLIGNANHDAQIKLTWNGPHLSTDLYPGETSVVAPIQLNRAINFLRS